MIFKTIACFAALVCGTVASAGAQTGAKAGGNDERAVQLLQAIEQKYGKVPGVTGTFTQQQKDKTFGAGKSMQARFSLLKPKDFKIEEVGNEPEVTLVTGGSLYKYVPKLKQVTKHALKQSDLHYLALGFGARTNEILSLYNVKSTSGGSGIELRPRNSKTAQFKAMTIKIDEKNLVPEQFTVEQSDDSTIELAINKSSLDFGADLSSRDFKPNFPPDAQIVDMN